ncbi:hypothetical protein TcWFU_002011 [Taenia crassiceps]|uniref:Uncharacterized protein n=1 Tax=Taenia crassiceps TaxID=6207 RepID=A0ABR4QPM2_9CEST
MHALSRSLPGFCKLLRSKRKIQASFVVNHLSLQPPRTATLLGVERYSPNINRGRGILTTLHRPRTPRRRRLCRSLASLRLLCKPIPNNQLDYQRSTSATN